MSIETGRQSAESITAFNEHAKTGGNSPLEAAAKALLHRSLGTRHFDNAATFLRAMEDAAPIKIFSRFEDNPEACLARRQLRLSMLYMTVTKYPDGKTDIDEFSPTALKSVITDGMVFYAQRTIPMFISSEHTEFRFRQRTDQTLDYTGDDFQYAMLCSLAMARAIEPIMMQKQRRAVPVSLPHTDGLLLGHAVLCEPDQYWPIESILAHRNKGKAVAYGIVHNNERVMLTPSWSPGVFFRVKTFISHDELKPHQQALHRTFRHFFGDAQVVDIMNDMINDYMTLSATPDHSFDVKFNALDIAIRHILEGADWKAANDPAEKNIPRHLRPQ